MMNETNFFKSLKFISNKLINNSKIYFRYFFKKIPNSNLKTYEKKVIFQNYKHSLKLIVDKFKI